MTADLKSVRRFWEGHVNSEYYTHHPRGSREYFAEIERRRYQFHYHLPELFARIASQGVEGKRLLEIGCGIGIDTRRLAALGFAEVVGIDLSAAAIGIATQRATAEAVTNVRFMVGNAEQLEFADGSFDVAFTFGVIHHTPDIDKAVSELYRVLKPGGRVYAMVYHSRSLINLIHQVGRLPYERRGRLQDDSPVVQRFTRRQALRLFDMFPEVTVHTDYPFTYGMRWVSAAVPVSAQRWLGRSIGWHLMIEAKKDEGGASIVPQ